MIDDDPPARSAEAATTDSSRAGRPERTCAVCGGSFWSSVATARYCGRACRQRAWTLRWAQRELNAAHPPSSEAAAVSATARRVTDRWVDLISELTAQIDDPASVISHEQRADPSLRPVLRQTLAAAIHKLDAQRPPH